MEIFLLDTRVQGRTKQPEPFTADGNLTVQHIIGADQATWLLNGLQSSTAKWKVIGSQVIFGQLFVSQLGTAIFADGGVQQWDGYEASRNQILNFLDDKGIKDVVFITGDLHSSFVQDLQKVPGVTKSLAVEFNGPSVSSITGAQYVGSDTFITASEATLRLIEPHLRFVDLKNRGYVMMTFTDAYTSGQYQYVSDIGTRTYTESTGAIHYTYLGKNCIFHDIFCNNNAAINVSAPLMTIMVMILVLVSYLYV
jgi:alkaline phosphatase D